MTDAGKPTVALVHGAFADASGWSAVYRELAGQGFPVYAAANPLRGVAADGDYIGAFVPTIDGPRPRETPTGTSTRPTSTSFSARA